MKAKSVRLAYSVWVAVLIWGGLWGIFEATAGYLLHLLPFSVGWLVWYPVACFFMANVYRKTGNLFAVLLVGLLCAGIKLINLFLPCSIDRVLNPAVSIVFETMAMAALIWVSERQAEMLNKNLIAKGLGILCMNSCWRVLYALYLLLLAPHWIYEISVIRSIQATVEFLVLRNLGTSLLLFGAYAAREALLKPIVYLERRLSAGIACLSPRAAVGVKTTAALCLLLGSIALELLL